MNHTCSVTAGFPQRSQSKFLVVLHTRLYHNKLSGKLIADQKSPELLTPALLTTAICLSRCKAGYCTTQALMTEAGSRCAGKSLCGTKNCTPGMLKRALLYSAGAKFATGKDGWQNKQCKKKVMWCTPQKRAPADTESSRELARASPLL